LPEGSLKTEGSGYVCFAENRFARFQAAYVF